MEILELISKYFHENCLPKNIYEHPLMTLQKVRDLVLNGHIEQAPPFLQMQQLQNLNTAAVHNNQHS